MCICVSITLCFCFLTDASRASIDACTVHVLDCLCFLSKFANYKIKFELEKNLQQTEKYLIWVEFNYLSFWEIIWLIGKLLALICTNPKNMGKNRKNVVFRGRKFLCALEKRKFVQIKSEIFWISLQNLYKSRFSIICDILSIKF